MRPGFKFSHRPQAVLFCLVMGVVLMACGCAGKKPIPGLTQVNASAEAGRTFNYMVYLDNLACMQKYSRTLKPDPNSRSLVLMCQNEADKALSAILKDDPSAYIYMQKAELYWNKDQVGKSRDILKQGLDFFPEDKTLLFALANTYLLQGMVTQAVDTLNGYLVKNPDDIQARKRLAEILSDEGAYAQAVDVLSAIDPKKRDSTTLYLLARANAQLGKQDQAVRQLKRAVAMDPEFVEAKAELAFLYEQDKDYEAAAEIYAGLMKNGDIKNEIRLRLLTLSLKMRDPDKALSLALDSDRDELFLLDAARLFIDYQYFDQATKVLDVVEAMPLPPEELYFFRAAVAYEGNNDAERAMEYLSGISRTHPYFYKAQHFKAHLLAQSGRTDEALEIIKQAQKEFPAQKDFSRLEARILADRDQDQKAVDILEKLIADDPTDTESLYQLSMVYEKQGKRDKALELMESLIKIDPENADALNYVGYTLAEMNQSLDRALVLVKNALKQRPGNGYIIDSLAWVYFKSGNTAKAWREIKKAVAVVRTDPTIWEHYGDIALAMGYKKSAAKGFSKALKFQTRHEKRVRAKLKAAQGAVSP